MPKLWNDTLESHRREVGDAILDTAAALIAEHGLRSVTMLQIAEKTGIGRATLYKYFPDVEAILVAWHTRHISRHLQQLESLAREPGPADERLQHILSEFARIQHEHDDSELSAMLHRGEHVTQAEQHLNGLLRHALKDAAKTGSVRKDVPPDELASYCLHALAGARSLPSKAAVRRLVALTIDGLRKR